MENGAMVLDLEAQEDERSWKQDLEIFQSQVDSLRDKLLELKVGIQHSEGDAKREMDVLWCKVGTISTLLSALKSNARNMSVMHLSQCSCVTMHRDGIKISNVDAALCDCSKDVEPSYQILAKEASFTTNFKLGSLEANDRTYTGEVLRSVGMVTDIMESLVKRVIIAETEVVYEKEKVNFGLTELRRKRLQIDRMSTKVKEMENLAASTNDKLNDMSQRVEHLMQETSRQKQHAVENERELFRVKEEFEMLRSYVSNLIRSREEVFSSDSHVQTGDIFNRLVEKNSRLENETVRKEAEVQKLMDENVRLRNLLDNKEAQLLAMNEQCKFMALNKGGI